MTFYVNGPFLGSGLVGEVGQVLVGDGDQVGAVLVAHDEFVIVLDHRLIVVVAQVGDVGLQLVRVKIRPRSV